MPARRRCLAAAVLATTALSPLALAHAASLPTIDVWEGKTTKKHDAVFIANVRPRKAVQVSVTVTCLTTDGTKTRLQLASDARLSGAGVVVDQRNATGNTSENATLRLKAKLPRTRAATGTVSWTMPASGSYQACSGRDTFRLKHLISHGG